MKALDFARMMIQWFAQWSVRMVMIFVGLFVCAYGVRHTKKATNPMGVSEQAHDQKYIDQGASGYWWFLTFASDALRPWSNYEDGLLAEPSGKTSARVKGKEATLFWMWWWSAVRNPVNYASRVWEFFAVDLRDVLTIEYWGDYQIDKHRKAWLQWYLTKTTTHDGRHYYGFRMKIRYLWEIKLGVKVKPEHRHGDDPDDQKKGCTFRLWFLDWIAIYYIIAAIV